LISVKVDLASSIAIRYVCQLAELTGLGLQTLYVVKPDEKGRSPGTGWVRQTWEDALVQKHRAGIAQLLQAEKESCPGLGNPKIAVGSKDMEILRELQVSGYDLFTEGLLHAFDPDDFLKKIHSRLYRNLPCPVLLVKNMVGLEKGVLVLGEENDLTHCVASFLKIFEGTQVEPDLLCCSFQKTEGAQRRKEPARKEEGLRAAEEMLAEKGRKSRQIRRIQGTVQRMEESVRDYGLVLASLARENLKASPLVDLLSRCPSAVLISWR